ncbi:MAG TPA: PepSY domain-containing protein [Methanobacterium sp.]
MVNKLTVVILALIIVVVVGAGIYAGSTQLNPSNQSNDTGIATTNDSSQLNTSQNDSGQKMISASEAQNIAKQYIEEPNATAGTPRLDDEGKIYIVPVLINGSTVGQIEIDAYTGKNVGGAGGAS